MELFLRIVKRIKSFPFKEMGKYLTKDFSKAVTMANKYKKMLNTRQLLEKQITNTCCIIVKIPDSLHLTNTISRPDKDVLMASLIQFSW